MGLSLSLSLSLSLRWPIPTETNAIIGHFYSSIRLLLSFFHSFFPLSTSLPPPPSPASPRVSFIVFYFFSFDRDGPKAPRKTVGLVAVAGTRSDDYRQMQHTHRHTHTDTHTDTHRQKWVTTKAFHRTGLGLNFLKYT